MSGRGYDVVVVGGAGHVGAALAIVMASKGVRTLVYDTNAASMDTMASGKMPFLEHNAEPLLKRALADDMLGFSRQAADIAGVPIVILTIGTPIDEFHNPLLRVVTDCIGALLPYLTDDQTLILRSTVFPGVTDFTQRYLLSHGKKTRVAFCPERVVQGFSVEELQTIPQIVSGTSGEAEETAALLFGRIAPKIVRMPPKEAEFAKLITNAYRYIQFAAANQFYMLVESAGLDYARLLAGLKQDYPRVRDLPGPGFAAGPCLYKDTLQLAAFASNHFNLGLAAIQVNEGLPAFLVEQMAARYPLATMTVGLLGMSFKADSDDVRSSLSFKLKKLLEFQAKAVLCTDPFAPSPDLVPLDDLLARADLFVLCAPHTAYRDLDLRGKPIVDIWRKARAADP